MSIVLDLTNSRNVEEVAVLLKKLLEKTVHDSASLSSSSSSTAEKADGEKDKGAEYGQCDSRRFEG